MEAENQASGISKDQHIKNQVDGDLANFSQVKLKSGEKIWVAKIKVLGDHEFEAIFYQKDESGQNQTLTTELFGTRDEVHARVYSQVVEKLSSGFGFVEQAENLSDAGSTGSTKSGRGILSNLTLHDSNAMPNLKRKKTALNKRNAEEIRDSGVQDSTQKKLKSGKKFEESPRVESQSSQAGSNSKLTVSKRQQLKKDIESAKLIESLKKEGDIIDLDTLTTPGKLRNLSPSKSQQDPVVKQNPRDLTRSMSKNSITPRTPNSIRSLVASALITPPKIDYKEIAQYNTVPIRSNAFLTETEIADIFDSPPPQHIPASTFRGIYLERKVFVEFVPSIRDTGLPLHEVVTEYYSLQIDQNVCYFEYGVIEEPDAMQCQLHECYEFIESYCLTHKIKQLRTEIGFEEKREKLVYSLNQKLVDTIKLTPDLYFKHERRMCEDPETSFRVLKSQERSLKSKQVFDQDDRQIAVVRELNSGSRRSGVQSTNVSSNRLKSTLSNDQKQDAVDLLDDTATKEPEEAQPPIHQNSTEQNQQIVSRHNPLLVDKDPVVNVREDIGQSDLEVMYDKFSHSNPLHDFVDIDINTEFRGSYEVSAEELTQRKAFMENFYKGEVKTATSFEK